MADSNGKVTVTLVRIKANAAYRDAVATAAYRDAVATGIALDLASLNRYLRDDKVLFTDALTTSVEKTTLDSFGLTESFITALSAERAFTDVVTTADDIQILIGRSLEDNYSFSDASTLSFGKNESDSITFDEVVNTLLTYERVFTDAFALDDTLLGLGDRDFNKANVFGFNDVSSATFGKALTDSYSVNDLASLETQKQVFDSLAFSDANAIGVGLNKNDSIPMTDLFTSTTAFNPSLQDSTSLTENFSLVFLNQNSAALNVSALNTFALNS